jgi:hypothetical protein
MTKAPVETYEEIDLSPDCTRDVHQPWCRKYPGNRIAIPMGTGSDPATVESRPQFALGQEVLINLLEKCLHQLSTSPNGDDWIVAREVRSVLGVDSKIERR